MATLGDRLRSLRSRTTMSQEDAAKRFGVTKQAWGNWERDEREPPLAVLIQIADMFDVTVDYLLGRTEDEHGIENGSITDDEKRFMDTVDKLTVDELEKQFRALLSLRDATAEEIEEAIKYIKAQRIMRQM